MLSLRADLSEIDDSTIGCSILFISRGTIRDAPPSQRRRGGDLLDLRNFARLGDLAVLASQLLQSLYLGIAFRGRNPFSSISALSCSMRAEIRRAPSRAASLRLFRYARALWLGVPYARSYPISRNPA